MENLLLSIDDAAKTLSLGKTKLYSEMKKGRLVAFKIGKRTLFSQESIQSYIDSLELYSPNNKEG